MKVILIGVEYDIEFHEYSNKRTAIELVNKDGSPHGRITINLPDEDLKDNEVAIDNNMRMFLPELRGCGLLGEKLRTITKKYAMWSADYAICELLSKG